MAEHFENKIEQIRWNVLFCNKTHHQEMLLLNPSNGLGNKTVISCLFIVWSNYYPLVTVDDLMHYCTLPSVFCNSAPGHQHLGVIVLTIHVQQTGMKLMYIMTTYYITFSVGTSNVMTRSVTTMQFFHGNKL